MGWSPLVIYLKDKKCIIKHSATYYMQENFQGQQSKDQKLSIKALEEDLEYQYNIGEDKVVLRGSSKAIK